MLIPALSSEQSGKSMPTPLFVCHANCCRSVLACYLSEHLCPGCTALGAGISAGDRINDRAEAMLRGWGIHPKAHIPRQLDRALCDQADALFVMEPRILRVLLRAWGDDLAEKCYLFADPFTRPVSFEDRNYSVRDPSFDHHLPIEKLHEEFSWFRDRVVEIYKALHGQADRPLVPASEYRELLEQL
jgi:protein-tyrosine-phosphatase